MKSLPVRFWSKVKKGNPMDCWEWTAAIKYSGYGMFSYKSRNVGAHVIAYYLHTGIIDNTKTLDNLCRNRKCVNPHHLDLGNETFHSWKSAQKGKRS